MTKPENSRVSPARGAGLTARTAAGGAFVAISVLLLAACSSGGKSVTSGAPLSGGGSSGTSSSSAPASSASSSAAPAKPVHVSLNIGDGGQVGVGMPIIATFKTKVTSGVALQQATKVTANGLPVQGAWYFEYSDPSSGHVMEAHYRPQNYWPAHAKIHMDLPIKGVSAGKGLAFDDNLTLDFYTGPQDIATVDDVAHTLTLRVDGKVEGTYPVSLGAPDPQYRTLSGTKVIMEHLTSVCMRGPGYYECGVKYDQRLTYGGEYLHAAPWNISNIEHGVDSSNGCTNLLPADAEKLFNIMEIGDVVLYPNANGGKMQLGQGYGDWNVPWSVWQNGGAVSTKA